MTTTHRQARRTCSWCGVRVRRHFSPWFKCGRCREQGQQLRRRGILLGVAGLATLISWTVPSYAGEKNCQTLGRFLQAVAEQRDVGVSAKDELKRLGRQADRLADKSTAHYLAYEAVKDVYVERPDDTPNDIYLSFVNNCLEADKEF